MMLWDYANVDTAVRGVVVPGDTVPTMFWNAVQARGDKVALRQKELGIWREVTWRQFGDAAREIGLGFIALGLQPGEVVSILANTRKEWLYADFGCLGAAGVTNGIYPTDSAGQVEFLSRDSDTKYLVVEDEEQLDKALEVRERLPGLRKIVVIDMEGLHEFKDPQVMSLDALRELGRKLYGEQPRLWEERTALRKPDELAILIYTSGTTGKPKGAMLSHRNLIHSVRGTNMGIGQTDADERMAFLPLCHVAERQAAYASIYAGAKMNFVEHPETVPENVREISPTFFGAVPRVWEKFYSAIQIALKEATPLERWAYDKAIGWGYEVADLFVAGKPVPSLLRLKYRVGKFAALDNIRKIIGIHKARVLFTGAAPISPDLVRWYLALGVPMSEVWGQTESCSLSTYTPLNRIKPGRIGIPGPFNEVKVSPDGELLIRGDNVFMGYLNLPDKTKEALHDGWLHTGDVGDVDEDGYFKITDRMKDIIITAGGKNITPSEIENQIKFSPYVTDAVVIGDKRPFLTCLIMIDQENVEKFAQDHDIPFSNYASLCRAPEVQTLIQEELDKVNKQFARVEQVKKFRLIEVRLDAEDEELTPTMKLKRKFVNQKYADVIEGMYREPA
jgi:long-chain acyl-CoA synthetase